MEDAPGTTCFAPRFSIDPFVGPYPEGYPPHGTCVAEARVGTAPALGFVSGLETKRLPSRSQSIQRGALDRTFPIEIIPTDRECHRYVTHRSIASFVVTLFHAPLPAQPQEVGGGKGGHWRDERPRRGSRVGDVA